MCAAVSHQLPQVLVHAPQSPHATEHKTRPSFVCQKHPVRGLARRTPESQLLPRDPPKEIVVREADFRRHGMNVAKLSQCQLPKWQEPQQPLSKQEEFEQICRSPGTIHDVWATVGNPEIVRLDCVDGLTVNKRWLKPDSPKKSDEPKKSTRRPSSPRIVDQPEKLLPDWEAHRLELESEAKRRELLDWVQKVANPLSRMHSHTVSTSSGTASRPESAQNCSGSSSSSCRTSVTAKRGTGSLESSESGTRSRRRASSHQPNFTNLTPCSPATSRPCSPATSRPNSGRRFRSVARHPVRNAPPSLSQAVGCPLVSAAPPDCP